LPSNFAPRPQRELPWAQAHGAVGRSARPGGPAGNYTVSTWHDDPLTVEWGEGDGNQTFTIESNNFTNDATATLLGLTAGNVTLTRGAGSASLLITNTTTGNVLTVVNQFNNAWQGINTLSFADGTSWSYAQIANLIGQEGASGSTFTGTSGNDVFDTLGHAEKILGSGGYDTYLDRAGYGALEIDNSTPSGSVAAGELDFGAGITDQNLWLVQSGNNLQIDLLGTNQTVTLDGWFGNNASAALAEIKTTDGMRLDAGLVQLVSAMATYSAANPGFNPATATQMPADSGVQSAIAAAWHH